MLVSATEMLKKAKAGHYAVGLFLETCTDRQDTCWKA